VPSGTSSCRVLADRTLFEPMTSGLTMKKEMPRNDRAG